MKEESLLESGTLNDSVNQKGFSKEDTKNPNSFVENNFFITLPWSPQVLNLLFIFNYKKYYYYM